MAVDQKGLAVDELESSGMNRQHALSLLQFLGLSDKSTVAQFEKAGIEHGQNYQTPKTSPGGLSGFLDAIPGAAERVGKDIAGYPGQALNAANTLVGKIPGANSLANFVNNDIYGPLGTAESAVGHALFGGGGGGGGQPAQAPQKQDTGSHLVTREVPTTFDLSAAVQQAAAPYTQALQQAASGGIPGLNGYLQNVPAGIANTIRSGLGNEQQAEQGLAGALQTQQANEGNAGLLTDLLNAARYQAIYKQGLYAPAPPANTDLGQLYTKVTAGGNSLLGVPGSSLPGGTPGGTNPAGVKNPYANPPKV